MKVDTVAKQLLFSTVRVETINESQNTMGVGTAFIFSLELEKTAHSTFLVTNKHVVEGADRGRFFFTRKRDEEPAMGERIYVEWDKFEDRWYKHPDADIDVAAMPIVPTMKRLEEMGHQIYIRHITDKMAPNKEQLESMDALEEILFVGYPSGIYDQVNLLPVFRKGVTATPLQVDYDGKPIFLIDASVFPGSSGSPVFIYNPSGYGTQKGFVVGSRFYFLGVVAEVLRRLESGKLEFVSIPTKIEPRVVTKETLDLGVVYQAKAVVETVQGAYTALTTKSS